MQFEIAAAMVVVMPEISCKSDICGTYDAVPYHIYIHVQGNAEIQTHRRAKVTLLPSRAILQASS